MPLLVIDDEADQASINTKDNRPPDPAVGDDDDEDDNLAPSLVWTVWTHLCCRNYAIAKAQADELVTLAFYRAMGLIMQGLVSGATGDAKNAIHQMESALTTYRAIGATLLTPSCYHAYPARTQGWDGSSDATMVFG